jgi:hypothetical protein
MRGRCILNGLAIVSKIKDEMHRPVNTIVDADLHYMCAGCHRSASQREQEEADWDF